MNNRDIFKKHLAPTSYFPVGIEVDFAMGSIITDTSGKEYIDLIAGIAVSSLGHQHPLVKQAILDQVNRHNHVMVYGEFVQGPQAQLAKAISDTLPDPLDAVFFVNSGSEAIEGALKLAKR